MLTFDHAAKLIGVPQADAQPLLIQALVNAIRDEEASERGIAYDQILDSSGREDLGGGVLTGITAGLRSSWKLVFATGSYQATVDGGNLADGLARVSNTGSPQVLLRSSVASTVVDSGGAGTAPSAGQVADAVWAHNVAVVVSAILRNKTVTDPVAGTMTVYADDGVTPLLTASLFEDTAGAQPYRGDGADRRDRLV